MHTLTSSLEFLALQAHAGMLQDASMHEWFSQNPKRFSEMSLSAADIFLDYSKNRVTDETMNLLFHLAQSQGVEERRQQLFAGERINFTENRAALHMALRAPRHAGFSVDEEEVGEGVHKVLEQMRIFSARVRAGEWRGFDGDAITDVVNIGIGGSDLGPQMACQAMRAYAQSGLNTHFVSNADGHDLSAVLATLNPAKTLFIITSKTFTTMETMMNAHAARTWFLQHGNEEKLSQHFVAVSTNAQAVRAFGIDLENMFPFWDWVGGRYSVWSAVGLPLMLAIGAAHFDAFLAGAYEMDCHFKDAPLEKNMPAILALIGIWNRNFLGAQSLSIAPYHQDLKHFPAYLQQLEMESNGKSIDAAGENVSSATCPVIWGACGTNGQHAYFQLLHQGTEFIPVDFIASLRASHHMLEHQTALLANCFAQAEALMRGKAAEEVKAEMQEKGGSLEQIEALVPHRAFAGNRPSNMILLEALTPKTLGALLALYEHKVFVQGVIWNINSFDQWGVELGKALAQGILEELGDGQSSARRDSSTQGLMNMARPFLREKPELI